jgi:hypothetical protein
MYAWTPGVFPELVDKRAFVDTIALSIRGIRRRLAAGTNVETNRGIVRSNRNYARAERGVLVGGNPYELRYGLIRLKGVLPPLMLILRSERIPLSIRNVKRAINTLCEPGWQASISQLELTFDLSGVSVGWLRKRVFTSARISRTLRSDDGRTTIYLGARTSPWQVRVYDKAPSVVRVEFILRRAFLRGIQINTPEDLRRMRRVSLQRLLSICETDPGALTELMGQLQLQWEDVHPRALGDWMRELPLQTVGARARQSKWKLPKNLFVLSGPETIMMREMQARLVI